jgi:hypothetical protein
MADQFFNSSGQQIAVEDTDGKRFPVNATFDQTTPGTTNGVQETSITSASAALTASNSATFTVGRYLAIVCTVAGNVKIGFTGGSSITIPVVVGLTLLPWAVNQIYVTGTTATATYQNLS